MTKSQPPAPGPDAAPRESRDFIAENLRLMFGAVESEELPERFKALLDRLAAEEKGR